MDWLVLYHFWETPTLGSHAHTRQRRDRTFRGKKRRRSFTTWKINSKGRDPVLSKRNRRPHIASSNHEEVDRLLVRINLETAEKKGCVSYQIHRNFELLSSWTSHNLRYMIRPEQWYLQTPIRGCQATTNSLNPLTKKWPIVYARSDSRERAIFSSKKPPNERSNAKERQTTDKTCDDHRSRRRNTSCSPRPKWNARALLQSVQQHSGEFSEKAHLCQCQWRSFYR